MSPSAELVAPIVPVDAAGWSERRAPLLDLLVDAVEDGAALGYRLPADRRVMTADWLEPVGRGLAEGRQLAWLAEDQRGLVGVVLLELAGKQNAPHRAQVQKLMVHRRYRRRGLGLRLMAEVEAAARARNRWLLVLDADDTAPAVLFYERLGWRTVGVVPDYSQRPDGTFKATRLFYKDLRERAW